MSTSPTKRQLEVHAFMLAYRDENSMWPTVREIAEVFGFASTNAVYCHLQALQRKGLTRFRPKCARGWIAVVIDKERCAACSPGGSTKEGQLPPKGTQCGLPAGHDGDHCVLIPSGMPWSIPIKAEFAALENQ